MAERQMLESLAELKKVWDRPDAVGLVIDEQAGLKIVRLEDGSEYAAALQGGA